ncbi:hypothetical protein [Streptococcus pneumoniae]|uniref:hypothetical protein n=1 Tax=Streptococcus pneumoniae TaxID=1313 RepID=UPI0021620760|nr:hypothetical protein [Streptococcus pneumoniae]
MDEEIKKAEQEVKAIKAKKADLQTFEDFQAINAKEKYIADMKAQRTKLEKNELTQSWQTLEKSMLRLFRNSIRAR